MRQAKPKKRIYFLPGARKDHDYPDQFGMIVTPSRDNNGSAIIRIKNGWRWICDNGAFKGNFDPDLFFGFLENMIPYRNSCSFVVCPDKFGDSDTTLQLFDQYAQRIKFFNFPVAFVAQDGQDQKDFPVNFDALFLGGSDQWRKSPGAAQTIKRAQKLGKWIHIGRVNSRKRIQYFSLLNVDSFDGTHLIYNHIKHRRQLIRWMSESNSPLFYL